MAEKITVTCDTRDNEWNITWIWSSSFYHTKIQAINNIENWIYNYFVNWRTQIVVKNWPTGKYLTTVPNETEWDNLDFLPICRL